MLDAQRIGHESRRQPKRKYKYVQDGQQHSRLKVPNPMGELLPGLPRSFQHKDLLPFKVNSKLVSSLTTTLITPDSGGVEPRSPVEDQPATHTIFWLEHRVNKRCERRALRHDDESTQQEEHNDDG
jgi:ribulose kinase